MTPSSRFHRLLSACAAAAIVSWLGAAIVPTTSAARAEEALPAHLLEPKRVEPITAAQFSQVLAHHAGEVVLVNLWATWCIPCVQELPDLVLLQERYGERGLRIIGVSMDDADRLDTRVRPFFAEKAPTLVSYLQAEADQFAFVTKLDADWVGAMPTTFFVDRAGKVVKSHTGRMLYRDLEREALKLLDQAAPASAPSGRR